MPLGTPRETAEWSGWFCGEDAPAQGFAPEASPTTYPTTLGFAWMNRKVELSTHSRDHYRVLIVPHGLVLTIAATLAVILAIRLIRRDGPRRPDSAHNKPAARNVGIAPQLTIRGASLGVVEQAR
ncbi:MAG: hypothetical protein WCO56_14910 [Verrucomicrobiota bacterium]